MYENSIAFAAPLLGEYWEDIVGVFMDILFLDICFDFGLFLHNIVTTLCNALLVLLDCFCLEICLQCFRDFLAVSFIVVAVYNFSSTFESVT